MAEEEELVPRTPRPVLIRNCAVLVGESLLPDPSFPVGVFETQDSGGEPVAVAIIVI